MTKDVVLIPGKAHPHALARLEQEFKVIRTESLSTLLNDCDPSDIRAVATFMAPIDAAFLDALPKLEIVSSFGVGYDHVDAKYAATKGVLVTHTPNVLDDEVADTAIGLLLNTIRQLPAAEAYLRAGKWVDQGPFPLTPLTLRQRTVGIVGLGRIGKTVAKRLEGFDVAIHYHNRSKAEGVSYPYHGTLISLAEAVDTMISVLPGTATTNGIINADIFKALGPNGVFINVGRGSVVNEDDLANALENRIIAAAGLDVFVHEPNVPDALLAADNAVLLPHVASGSVHTRQAMADLVVDNIIEWMSKKRALTIVPECQ